MDPRVIPLADILRLNTRLFRNCLDGMTEELARRRPSGSTNSASFIAAHLTDARFYLLQLLGADTPNPLAPYLANVRSLDDMQRLPTMAEIREAWTTAAHALRDRLETITTAELDAKVVVRFPMPDPTVFATLTFLVQHDSYHIGQLALLRKHAGLPAMSYR